MSLTRLLGLSLFLIAGAALTLVLGWAWASATLVRVSIACSVLAGSSLALAYHRSRFMA